MRMQNKLSPKPLNKKNKLKSSLKLKTKPNKLRRLMLLLRPN